MARRDRNRILCFESRFPEDWNSEKIIMEKADQAMKNVIFAMENDREGGSKNGMPYDVVVGKTDDGVVLRIVVDSKANAIIALYPDEITTAQTEGYAYGE